MIRASKALSSIGQAILGVRRDEDVLTKTLASAAEEAARLRAEQADGFKTLARIRLDALRRDEVVGRLDSAEHAAVAALKRRQALLADLAEQCGELTASLADAERARDAAEEQLETAIEAVEALTDSTSKRTRDDVTWQALTRRVEEVEAKAAAAAKKASQSETDRDEKRKPYDADPLFSYLWARGYGTSAYRANPLVRLVDARIARLVGYDTARPNYYMLNEIPLRLREHAERLEEVAAQARAEQERYERRMLETAGVVRLESEIVAATELRTRAQAKVDELQGRLAAIDERHSTLLDEARDPSLNAAIDGLVAAIAREDVAELYAEALATSSPEDERIVQRLREIESLLRRREAEVEEVRRAAVDLARKRAELEKARDEFRHAGYDHPRGRFEDGALIGGVIQEILRGVMSSGALNQVLRDGFSLPGPSGRRGGFGGGIRIPESSRTRGGGFRTGGGF